MPKKHIYVTRVPCGQCGDQIPVFFFETPFGRKVCPWCAEEVRQVKALRKAWYEAKQTFFKLTSRERRVRTNEVNRKADLRRSMKKAGCSTSEEYEVWKKQKKSDGLKQSWIRRGVDSELSKKRRNAWKSAKRRLQGKEGGTRWTTSQWYHIGEQQEWKCVYCDEELQDDYHADHKIPLARGGSNKIENIQFTCFQCNVKKSTHTHEEYLLKMAA
jgi:5-methylcytosine-specific restriction endonuclease McrA